MPLVSQSGFPGVQLVLSGWMLVETRTYISCAADWSRPPRSSVSTSIIVEFPRWRGSFSRCLLKSSMNEGQFSGRLIYSVRENFACSRSSSARLFNPFSLGCFESARSNDFNDRRAALK